MIKKLLVPLLVFGLLAAYTIVIAGQPSVVLSEGPPSSAPSGSPSVSPTGAEATMSPEPASEDPAQTPTVLAETLDQVFEGFEDFCGSVLIEKDGQVLLYKAYGLSDTETGDVNTANSKFLIGSVTKQFTSMAVMQLYEKGLLDIHDKLSEYIPDFPRGGDIELVDLLRQTSGIADYMNDGTPAIVDALTPDELNEESIITIIKTKPLKFEPGSKYSYSNTNYLILGTIVEKVSGLSYEDYLKQNIFDVLGMNDTGVFDIANPPENMTVGHWGLDKPVCFFTETGEIDAEVANATAAGFGAGCLYSTVWDLYLWDRALSTEKLLSKKYMDMIFAPAVNVVGAIIPSDYGFGWILQTDPDFGAIHEHTGTLGGFRAFNGLFVEHDITVILLYNNAEFMGRKELLPAVKQALLAL